LRLLEALGKEKPVTPPLLDGEIPLAWDVRH
jgi:hypothetical protein